MHIENENTLRNCLANGIVLFVGAGFSIHAADALGRALPRGAELKNELLTAFGLRGKESYTLAELSTYLERTRKTEFVDYLIERHTVVHFDPRYRSLENIRLRRVFTTNIDDLIPKIYANSDTYYIHDTKIAGSPRGNQSAIPVTYLHGCVAHRANFDFSTLDLASAYSKRDSRFGELTATLRDEPVLYCGYSVSDPGVLEALARVREEHRASSNAWILLRDVPEEREREDYYHSLGMKIIYGDTLGLLEYFKGFHVLRAATKDTDSSSWEATLDMRVPSLVDVAAVPVRNFFEGHPPEWHFILTGSIPRLSHYSRIENEIHSGKHVIVLGAEMSGKSTLLMQLAAHISFEGVKLITSSMTRERAVLLTRSLGGRRVLLFMDNVAESLEALAVLCKVPTVQCVCADRDYDFDIVSDRLPTERVTLISVNEIALEDIQQLRDRIPSGMLARGKPKTHKINHLLDWMHENLRSANRLRRRFEDFINKVSVEEPHCAEMFLLICYAHRSRVPAAMDMILSYFSLRDSRVTFGMVYELRRRLGTYIDDIFGFALSDVSDGADQGDQDYFRVRSQHCAELALSVAPTNLLQTVVETTLDIHSDCIAHYGTFRRRAYDAGFMKERVFPNADGGKRFYEKLYHKSHNFYDLQQGALYLLHKQRFEEAFTWIDRAITESGGKVFAIKNSHAVILFKANIEKDHRSPAVREQLDAAMKILRECVDKDKRKFYHVRSFAKNALQYHTAYRDVKAVEYLQQAREWLEWEKRGKHLAWDEKLEELLAQVSGRLARKS